MIAQLSDDLPYPFPQTDQQQARRQLDYLNFKSGKNVYLRFFYHSEDFRKNNDKGRKLDWLRWKDVEDYQQDGRGVYVVVNGSGGGHEDKDIKECTAIFCEWDDSPVEEQLLHWETVGFLEPTFTVYSGDKSAQPYWVFDAPITVEQWRFLQCLLIEVMGADPSNKNPSRVFRLAGGWHVKPGREPRRTEIVQDSGIKYSFEQLRERLLELKAQLNPEQESIQPSVQKRLDSTFQDIVAVVGKYIPLEQRGNDWLGDCPFCNAVNQFIVKQRHQTFECLSCQAGGEADNYSNTAADFLKRYQRTNNSTSNRIRYKDIQVPVPDSVPLEVSLSKESRALQRSGVSEGGRNTSGAKLARDLIGTAGYLQTIGQRFHGDPRQLLSEYAASCTPPLHEKEVDGIWKSAEKDRPGPSCTPEGVEACIRAWYWNNYVKPLQLASHSGRSGRGFGSGNSGNASNDGNLPIAAVSLCSRIREILSRYDTESLQVSALMDLAATTGRTVNDINQLAKIIRAEGDLAEEVIEAVKSFQGTLKSCRKRLEIPRYLDSSLADLLIAKAMAMPTAPEYLFNTLLPASASRIGTAARVIVNPEGGYKQPLIFWSANVANSGQAKTPPQEVVIEPLDEMEALAHQQYSHELELYESGDGSGKAPKRLHLLLKDTTSATKFRIHGDCPRGLLEYIDELMGDYERLNQFKGGKGDDLRLELSFWGGGSCNYNRNDVRLYLKRTAISKTGTYQWDTLARLMADEVNFIGSGYSARFLYCSIVDAPVRYLDLFSDYGGSALKEKLRWLYGELGLLPEADYLLSHEAKVLFQGWNHTLVNAEIEEAHYGLSLVYAKIESYTARIALWLHIVNAVLRGEKPAPVISGETMQHAIEIASFYLWQHKLIHAHNSPTRKLEGIFLKVQNQAEKFKAKCGKGVGASYLKTRINALKSWVVEKIRSTVFKTLAAAGHGRTEGEGAFMVYIPNTVHCAAPDSPIGGIGDELVVPSIAESSASSEVQSTIGEIGAAPEDLSSSQSDAVVNLEDLQSLHQFTNSAPEPIAESEFQSIGGHQLNHQPPIEKPPPGEKEQVLSDEVLAAWHQRLNNCQTFDDAFEFSTALDALSPQQRHQFESSVPPDLWAWLWNLPVASEQKPELALVVTESEKALVDEPESVPEAESVPQAAPVSKSVSQPTLEELKALLLACDSLGKLNEIKRSHSKKVSIVYNSMSAEEQSHIDGLAALAVPYKVFKYLGDTIVQGTERLLRGTLVYVDPQARVRTTAYTAPVWVINGVARGWKCPIDVSLSLLKEVTKAVSLSDSGEKGQQLGLI